MACDVLHVCLFSENRHFSGLAFASATVTTAAELEYIACHATHGKAFSVGFGFLFTAIETMRHDDGWLACFSGVRDEGFSPNVLSVATLAMNLACGERVVEVGEVLGFHGVVGKCTEVVAQEHVDVLTLVLKLPTEPHAEHLREGTAILLVEGAIMTYAQLIGKCHRHVLDVLVIDNGVGISHIALSTNEIEDRTMQFLQVFLAGTRHGYVSHARVAHDVGLHAWVSSIGKHLRASATLSTECHILEVDALVIDTFLVLVHLLSPVDSTNHVLVRRLIEFAVINTLLHLAQSNDEVTIRGEVVEHLFVWQRCVVASAIGKDEQRKWSFVLHGCKHVLWFIDYEARKCGFRNGFRFEWSATTLIYDFLGGCSDAGNG